MPRDVVTSVCIPTYNRAGMLRRAIRSAQAQTERRIEILISDNASTDRTEDLVSGLAEADARIRYVRNARNLGMVGNWNRCLAEASARLMCLLSDDDTLTPGAVAAGRDLLGRHPEAVMAFGASRQRHDVRGLLRTERYFSDERVLSSVEAHRTIWLYNCFKITHAILRPAAARAIGGFYADVGWCADTDFELRMAARASIAVTPVEMGDYFVHRGQLSGTNNRQVYRWQCRMVDHVMRDVKDKPLLAALRPLAEGEYLSRYAIHFGAAALKRGRSDEAAEFLASAQGLGLPRSKKHIAMYCLMRSALAVPGGVCAFKALLAPVLSKVAARYA